MAAVSEEQSAFDPKQRLAAAVLNSLWVMVAGRRFHRDDPGLRAMVQKAEFNVETLDPTGPLNYFPWLQMGTLLFQPAFR